jgi:pimeloyl-ACP methyl ester carboxylesterase
LRRLRKALVGVAAALVVVVVLNMVAVNNDTKPAEVTVPGGRILELTGGELQGKEDGPAGKPPIVLLHGWTASLNWWDRITPLLARGHRVIRIDLLGHGGSQKPASGYSIQNQAKLVAEALNQLGVSGATVVGHSMGGSVATALTQQSPQLVSQIVLIDSAPANNFINESLKSTLAKTPVIGQTLWRITPRSVSRSGQAVAFTPGYDFPQVFTDDIRAMTYTAFTHAADASHGYIDQAPLDERLGSLGVRIPVLVIFGSKDRRIDPEAANEYRDVPGAEVEMVTGTGHSPQVEKPVETASLILNFAVPAERAAAQEKARQERAARQARIEARRQARAERRAKAKAKAKARRRARKTKD